VSPGWPRRYDAAFPSGMAAGHAAASRTPSRAIGSTPIYSIAGRKQSALRKIDKSPMLNDVYNAKILDLAGNIPRLGRLDAPDASATAHSKLCGSTVTVDVKMDGPVVGDFAHDVKACALGQASSSIMARHVVGSKPAELRELREIVRKMLKENGAPPTGKWADIAVLEPVRDYKARHASTLLTFDAVVQALDQIEAGRKLAAE
jgi:NifU-like protein involved in Fe-S cluster formation